MACTLSNKCANNLSKQTVLLQLIIKNVVTCFFGTQCIISEQNQVFNRTEPNSFRTESEFFSKAEPKTNRNKKICFAHPYGLGVIFGAPCSSLHRYP